MQVRIQTIFLKECAPEISTMLNGHSTLHQKREVSMTILGMFLHHKLP